ncbi:MAG TPA: TIR domain-containing protein [Clostridia bacterium]|nr:TIR domain-containing protein [Clostridia bacterium]HRN13986.1 TIR domain-containing protein [Clostridia bacterium]
MNQKEMPIPYIGEKPYIFVSYAHKDSEVVMRAIALLQQSGFRVWYDEGIDPGSEWPDTIEKYLERCSYLIGFISANSLASQNCTCELYTAYNEHKRILVVYLEDVQLKGGLKMQLSSRQSIHWYKYESENAFFKKLLTASGLNDCRESENNVKTINASTAAQANSNTAVELHPAAAEQNNSVEIAAKHNSNEAQAAEQLKSCCGNTSDEAQNKRLEFYILYEDMYSIRNYVHEHYGEMISASSIAVEIAYSSFAEYGDTDNDRLIGISALWDDVNIGEKIDALRIFYTRTAAYKIFENYIERIKNLPNHLSNLRTLKIEGMDYSGYLNFGYYEKELKQLVLRCHINDDVIRSISNITSLRHLDLGNGSRSEIRDISPLGNLKNLRTLVISGTLRELSPIARLENLEELTIFSDVLSDISVLGELKRLKALEIYRSEYRPQDMPKGILKRLKAPKIYGSDYIDLKALEELTNSMQCLVVKVKCINNIDSLTMLANLRHLELRAENIKDIRPLRNLKRVRYLEVSKNFWTSLQIKQIAKELGLEVAKYTDHYLLTK